MPVSWRIADGMVLIESSGAPAIDEWKAAVDSAIASPAFRPGMSLVHDLRRMSRLPNPSEARGRIEFVAARSRTAQIKRWAIVVQGVAHYGMGRMAEILSDFKSGIEFRVFRELEEAVAWAGSPEAAKGGAA